MHALYTSPRPPVVEIGVRNWSIIFEDQVIVQWPYWSRHVTYVSYVTIDTNHVMIDYFDVMNGRNYVTKDDLMNDADE